jgi:hypothetical protein
VEEFFSHSRCRVRDVLYQFNEKLFHFDSTRNLASHDLTRTFSVSSLAAVVSLMLGSPVSAQCDSKFSSKAESLTSTFRQIMKTSAKLMSYPPSFADKWNLKIWSDFESAAKKSLELCKILLPELGEMLVME